MDYAKHFFVKSRDAYNNYTCSNVPYEFRAELARSHGMVCGSDYTVSLTGVITTVTTPIFFHRYKSNFYNNNGTSSSNSSPTVHPVICIKKFKYNGNSIKIYDGYVYFETDESKLPLNLSKLNLSKLNFTAANSISGTNAEHVQHVEHVQHAELNFVHDKAKIEKDSWLTKAIEALKFI